MTGSRRLATAAAGLGLLALAGCLEGGRVDLALVADAAFPAAVPGLPADRPWTFLPVRTWVLESGWEVDAVAACLPPGCAPAALVAALRVRGPEAGKVAAILDEPGRLGRELEARKRGLAARLAARARPPSGTPPVAAPPAVATVEKRRDGPQSGFEVSLARPDGERSAHGIVLGRQTARGVSLVLAVAPAAADAQGLAGAVAPQLR